MKSSFPAMSVGKTIKASPPKIIAALVVTLPMTILSGGQTRDANPKRNKASPTQVTPRRLANFEASSRDRSF
jgi:hypothetical protein